MAVQTAQKKQSKKNGYSQTHSFISVFQLFNTYWWKSFFGPFFAFGFSFLIYAILGAVMDYRVMFPGVTAMVGMSQGISGLPGSIMELKQSVLLKRIGASPIKTSTFSLVIVTHYLMISILVLFYMMIWALVFTQDTSVFDNIFGNVGSFFTYLYGFIINITLGITVGFLIASFAKSANGAQAIGMLIYFPSTFLSGQFISPAILANSDVMNYLSKCIPFRYSTMYMTEGWLGYNPFDFAHGTNFGNPAEINEWLRKAAEAKAAGHMDIYNDYFNKVLEARKTVFDSADHIVGTFYPYIYIFGALIISSKKFKWSSNR